MSNTSTSSLADTQTKAPFTAVGRFFSLTFFISWLGWIPAALYTQGVFPFQTFLFSVLGIGGPTVAAVLAVYWEADSKERRDQLLRRVFSWRATPKWYGIALGLPVLFVGLGMIMWGLLGRGWPDFSLLPATAVPGLIIGWVLTSLWEEVGWRGYALPRLQQRLHPTVATFLLSMVWGLWHIPLQFNVTDVNTQVPFWLGMLNALVASVIYTWLYNRSGQIMGIAAVYHIMSNIMATVWLTTAPDFTGQYMVYTLLIGLTAVGLLLKTGGRLGWEGYTDLDGK